MKSAVLFGFLCCCSVGFTEKVKSSQKWADTYKSGWEQIKKNAEQNETLSRLLEQHFLAFNHPSELKATDKADFVCDLPPSESIPDNAHRVRPSDIKVVGSIGDSITAGYGITAYWIWEVLRNDRQESWCSGGQDSLDEGVVTTPNILRKINPDLKGSSTTESSPGEPGAGFNAAVGGAIAEELYDQAVHMRDLMWAAHEREELDYYNDWKLVNLLIGGNDLCSYCDDLERYSAEAHATYIKRTLDFLYNDGPPRMIVTLSTIFDITELPAFSDGIVCDLVQWFVCGCATDSSNHALLKEAQKEYHTKVQELVTEGRWDLPDRPDFTVLFLPHFENAKPPQTSSGEVDQSYWAADCFHPGRKAHQQMARSLWNQMFVAEEDRSKVIDWTDATINCPVETDPYIKTRLNSGGNANNRDLTGHSGTSKTDQLWKWPLDRPRFPFNSQDATEHEKQDNVPQEDEEETELINFKHKRISVMGRMGALNVKPVIYSTTQDGQINMGALAGGVVGGIVVIAGVAALLITLNVRRSKKRDDEQVLEMEN